MLIQTRRDARLISGKLFEEDPEGLTINEFNEAASQSFREGISRALRAGMPVIPVTIDSYGGSVSSLMAMAEVIRTCPVPVATIASGKAHSCGAVLLALGTPGYRFASPYSEIMVHRSWCRVDGAVPSLTASVESIADLDRRVFEMLADATHWTYEDFLRKLRSLEGANWYMRPEEAYEVGLIDRVGVPTLKVDVNVEMELSFDGD